MAFDRPKHVGVRHFAGGEFGHNRKVDVGEVSARAFVGSGGGEGPGGAFVVHQAAGAIDGVEDDSDGDVGFGMVFWIGEAGARGKAFGDENEGHRLGPMLEIVVEEGLEEEVEVVDGVFVGGTIYFVEIDFGTRGEEVVDDLLLEVGEAGEDAVGMREHWGQCK